MDCKTCGKSFYVTRSLVGKAKYCSRKCSHKGFENSVSRICEVCGAQFSRPMSQEKHRGVGRFCSKKCKGVSMSSAQRGERNPSWRGGVSPINKRIRASKKYQDWRETVFKRDGYTCVQCGVVGGYLHADHIKPFAFYPEMRFSLDNGRTLCVPCHKKTDTFGAKAVINYGGN